MGQGKPWQTQGSQTCRTDGLSSPSLPYHPHTAPGPGSPSSRVQESRALPRPPSRAGSSSTPQGPWAHQDTEGVAVWDFIVDQALEVNGLQLEVDGDVDQPGGEAWVRGWVGSA